MVVRVCGTEAGYRATRGGVLPEGLAGDLICTGTRPYPPTLLYCAPMATEKGYGGTARGRGTEIGYDATAVRGTEIGYGATSGGGGGHPDAETPI
eukprot:146617-Rhodomonas_salina.1